MYKSIVVGVDGSPTANLALEAAVALAQLAGATVHLVCAYGEPNAAAASASVWAPGAAGAIQESADLVRESAGSHLDESARQLRAKQIEVQTYAVPGGAAQAIVQVAETTGSDLVVVGSKGMTGARRVLGSVPNTVAHHAPCAVLVVKTC